MQILQSWRILRTYDKKNKNSTYLHEEFQLREVTNHVGLLIELHNEVNATNHIEGAACICVTHV